MLSYLRCVELAALLGVLVTFAFRGLCSYYPAFTMFLAAKGACALSLLSLDPNNLVYAKSWSFSAPFTMALQLLVLLELTSKIVEHYPRIDKRGGRIIIASCLTAGAVIGAVSYVFQFGKDPYPWYVPAAIGAYKIFDWITVGALAFVSVWLKLFPEPVRKNVQWHRWLLFAYIGVAPGIALMFATVRMSNGRVSYIVDCISEVVEIACFVLWIIKLTPPGEAFPYVPKSLSDEGLKQVDADYKEVFSALRDRYPLPETMKED